MRSKGEGTSVHFNTPKEMGLEDALEFISDDELVEVVWIDEALTLHGLKLLNSRPDKTWSLCDAVSFVIMRDQNLSHALTTDRHFQQAGFVGLLAS